MRANRHGAAPKNGRESGPAVLNFALVADSDRVSTFAPHFKTATKSHTSGLRDPDACESLVYPDVVYLPYVAQ